MTCQMVRAHHPDCTCETCAEGRDEICQKPSIGLHEGTVRVCTECAEGLKIEGFVIAYDPKPESNYMRALMRGDFERFDDHKCICGNPYVGPEGDECNFCGSTERA